MTFVEWETVPLSAVARLKRGFDLPTKSRMRGPYPVVGSAGISGWHNEGPVEGPGVVIGRSGSSMGHATYVTGDFWPLNTAMFVDDFLSNDPLFVYHLLSCIDFSAFNSGSAQPSLNRNFIANIPVAVPPVAEQRAIAELLGALDGKIALNKQIRGTALELAGANYDAATPGTSVGIGDIADLYDGPHATPHKTAEGPWFLSISSLKNGFLDLPESAHLSEEDFPRWTKRIQPCGGDVLFSYETRLGDAALMPPGIRGSLGRRMALLRSKDATVSGALLLHAYLSPAFQEEIKRRTIHGATVDRLPLKEMPGWRITLPVESERAQLSAKLDALHATVMQTAHENRTLTELRDTLLPQLVTGKLRVKDATRAVEEAV